MAKRTKIFRITALERLNVQPHVFLCRNKFTTQYTHKQVWDIFRSIFQNGEILYKRFRRRQCFFPAYFLIWGKGCSKNPYSFHAASYIVQFSRTRRDYEIENNTERIQTQNKDNIQPLLGRFFLIFKSLAIGNHDEIIFGKKLRSQDLVVTLFKLCPYNSQLNWRVLHKAAAFLRFYVRSAATLLNVLRKIIAKHFVSYTHVFNCTELKISCYSKTRFDIERSSRCNNDIVTALKKSDVLVSRSQKRV